MDTFDHENCKFIELRGPYGKEIELYFKRDTWDKNAACFMLIGVLPVKYHPIGYPKLNGGIIQRDEKETLIERGEMYLSLWESNPNNPDNPAPVDFINWAIGKNIDIPWLDCAIEQGLLPADVVKGDLSKVHVGKTEKSENPEHAGKIENPGRREQQHEIILATIAALRFDPLQIPDGGKSKIRKACLTRPHLFTPESFNHAWKVGVSAGLFRLANHEKFSPN